MNTETLAHFDAWFARYADDAALYAEMICTFDADEAFWANRGYTALADYILSNRDQAAQKAADTAKREAYEAKCAASKAADKLRRARERRQARTEAYRACGLVKVRGALGGTYWE